jgi:hypothetical protein
VHYHIATIIIIIREREGPASHAAAAAAASPALPASWLLRREGQRCDQLQTQKERNEKAASTRSADGVLLSASAADVGG